MKLLLTAFNAFGSLPVNPSQVLVERYVGSADRLPGCQIQSQILETSYALAEQHIVDLLDQFRPDVLLMFGVAQQRGLLSIERRAKNWDAATLPDNSGDLRTGEAIRPEGPAEYLTTIPAGRLVEALHGKSIPAELSDDAGAFVCNHTLYAALHHSQKTGTATRCGFVHIPLPAEMRTNEPSGSDMTFDDLLRGVDACVRFLREWRQEIALAGTTG